MLGSDLRTNDLKYQLNSAAAAIDDAKNVSVLNPLSAPAFYKQAMELKQATIASSDPAASARPYSELQRIDDQKTGFNAASYINPETGHAVLVFRGTNFPLKPSGSSLSAFWKDFKAVMAENMGIPNAQLREAESTYLDLMKNPAVKSIELVGYSLGSIYVNHLSAKYGAYGTTIADLGLSSNALRATFNAQAMPGTLQRLYDRTVNLVLQDDLIVRLFGASPHRGRQIDLDTHKPSDLEATIHFVDVYLDKARSFNTPSLPVPA
jgi:hypothetical protein